MRISQDVRALSSLDHSDYGDLFSVTTDATATPEQWARAMFGNVPSAGELVIWRGILGIRLSRTRSPDTVGGWRIGGRGDNWVRLEAASWWLSGNLVVLAADGQVSLATFVRYDRPFGRLFWPPLSAIHRLLVPGVLRGAVAKVTGSGR